MSEKRGHFFFQRKGFSLKIKTERTCLGFFSKKRGKKCFNIFLLSFLGRKKIKKEIEEETETENEKWKLIEEEQKTRKTNLVKIFFKADRRKNNMKGLKKPKLQKHTKETLFWKKKTSPKKK